METVPPIITTAILINVKKYAYDGESMSAGEYVSINDIKKSIEASSLKSRGILPGDVVLIYTGWSENYQDPDELKLYYSMAPGISYSLAEYLASKKVVADQDYEQMNQRRYNRLVNEVKSGALDINTLTNAEQDIVRKKLNEK